MTEPTDDEIAALRSEFGITSNGRGIKEYTQVRDFARAVLAKWGTPPAVAGEPVAWLSTDSIGERYLCFTKPNDSDPVRPLVFGDTTPQPTPPAVVEPLEPVVSNVYGINERIQFRRGWRAAEAAHGIGIKKENGNG